MNNNTKLYLIIKLVLLLADVSYAENLGGMALKDEDIKCIIGSLDSIVLELGKLRKDGKGLNEDLESLANSQYTIKDDTNLIANRSIDGVKFCEFEEDANAWILNNPDKKVIDVKFSTLYATNEERKVYSLLISYQNRE